MISKLDNTIVIPPSSPEQNWARSVSPCTPTRLFGLAPLSPSSPALPSPSELFEKALLETKKNLPQTTQSIPGFADNTTTISAKSQGLPQDDASTGLKEPALPKAKQQRSRKRSTTKETQNKIITGRVAKSKAAPKAKSSDATGQKDSVVLKPKAVGNRRASANRAQDGQLERGATSKQAAASEELYLEEAMKRRLDWTPPKASEPILQSEDVSPNHKDQGSHFGNILRDFHYNCEDSISELLPPRQNINPLKRRRLELVNRNASHEQDLAKSKSAKEVDQDPKSKPKPKKKPKTITARVTAFYEQLDESGDLLVYDESLPCESEQKTKRVTKTKKKPETECIILSPIAATKTLNEQHFLFGTCSQLERDDSPTLFEETQQALRLSEMTAAANMESDTLSTFSSATGIASRFTGRKSLWSGAARDPSGIVVQPEVIDMTASTTVVDIVDRTSAKTRAVSRTPCVTSQNNCRLVTAVDVDGFISGTSTVPTTASGVPAAESRPKSTQSRKKPSSQTSDMPHFNGFTDLELKNQVVSYGFKPISGRKKMIALLEKCWQSKHGNAETSTSTAIASQVPPVIKKTASSTKRTSSSTRSSDESMLQKEEATFSRLKTVDGVRKPPVSKPVSTRKAGDTDNLIDTTKLLSENIIDEIQDSEEEIIPSPTRIRMQRINGRHRSPAKSCLPLSGKAKAESKPKSSGCRESYNLDLPSSITKAVRLQSRKKNNTPRDSKLQQLTWHEKILLYEPIILEDLATWLNTEGFAAVSEDREVGVDLVRAWCEGQGICCTFK